MAEITPGPSTSGSVVLELGPGQGALVLHTPPELDGQEMQISPVGGPPDRGTHSQVRQRHTKAGTAYCAVYPDLPPGDYQVWRDGLDRALTVTIAASSVTTARWPGQDAAITD